MRPAATRHSPHRRQASSNGKQARFLRGLCICVSESFFSISHATCEKTMVPMVSRRTPANKEMVPACAHPRSQNSLWFPSGRCSSPGPGTFRIAPVACVSLLLLCWPCFSGPVLAHRRRRSAAARDRPAWLHIESPVRSVQAMPGPFL